MPELLLEVGCEELPANMVRRASAQLREAICAALAEAGLPGGEAAALATPRRLIVAVREVPQRQPDRRERHRGPSIKAAFGPDDAPTPALMGFCKRHGLEPKDLVRDGDYVWAEVPVVGRPAIEVLPELLSVAIRSLSFDQTMRWGEGRMRFARPIRWILAAFGGQRIPFEMEGVMSGLSSRGHRFMAPQSFEATSFDGLIAGLRARSVEPDPAVREERIREGAVQVAPGKPALSDELVEENVNLTEWPTVIFGRFREEFLQLPEAVLVTAMAKHERFFPVYSPNGQLANGFVSIINSGDPDTVRQGNAWVLNARFNDAKFFFDEDSKRTLDWFLERTSGILFHEKLGTVRARADRLAALAEVIAVSSEVEGADAVREAEFARLAGLYGKADLASGLVSELPSLQGVVGGDYARREGFPEPVCWAIATHYDLAQNPTCESESARTAIRLLMADQIDLLAGFLSVGMTPSGSSDPFGLRRAASLLIEAAWRWPSRLPSYAGWFESARDHYGSNAPVVETAAQLFAQRYQTMLEGFDGDVIRAATVEQAPTMALDPQAVRFRAEVLQALRGDHALVQTCTRPLNILRAATEKGLYVRLPDALDAVREHDLESETARELLHVLWDARPKAESAVRELNVEAMMRVANGLAAPINRFFDATMVMDENERVRQARLTLVDATAGILLLAGDWNQIVIPG